MLYYINNFDTIEIFKYIRRKSTNKERLIFVSDILNYNVKDEMDVTIAYLYSIYFIYVDSRI